MKKNVYWLCNEKCIFEGNEDPEINFTKGKKYLQVPYGNELTLKNDNGETHILGEWEIFFTKVK